MMNNTTTTIDTKNYQQALEFEFVDYLTIFVYVVVFLIGVTGNLVICLFFTLENQRIKHLQVLIFYLALSDLCASVTNPLLFIYLQITHYRSWHFELIGCKLLPLTWRVSTSVSLGIIMVINIDRCIALKLPYHKPLSKSKVNTTVSFVTLASILMELPFLIYADVKNIAGSVSCKVPSVLVPGYAYPTLSIMFIRDTLYIAVFITTSVIIKRELSVNKLNIEQGSLQKEIRHHENRSVLNMLFIVAAAFVVTVFPRELLHIVYILSWVTPGDGIRSTKTITNLNSLLTSLLCCNTICNFIIYAKLQRRFRDVVVSTIFSFNSSTKATIPRHSPIKCWGLKKKSQGGIDKVLV